MREITVPPDVEFVDEVTEAKTGDKWSFYKFLCNVVLQDDRFGKTDQAIESRRAIRMAFKEQPAGTVVRLHPNDYDIMKESISKPLGRGLDGRIIEGYRAGPISEQCLDFIRAIKDAVVAKAATEEPKTG